MAIHHPASVIVSAWLLALALLPVRAEGADSWSLGLSGGPADRYTYRSLDVYGYPGYHERFGFSWVASVDVSRTLSRHFSLQADVGYLHYKRDLHIGSIPEILPPRSDLSAQIPSAGIGIRYYPATQETRPRAYLQLVPTLYLSRWKERNEEPEYTDFYGVYHPGGVTEDTFTNLLPGIALGAGLVGLNQTPVRLDLGFRFFYSASPGSRDLGQFSSGEFEGLRQLALVVGLHKPL